MFQGALERQNITVGLPRVAPEQLPLVINEDARICAVVEQRPDINPMVEYHYGPLWDLSGELAIANYDVYDTPVDFAKPNFRAQAADERYKKETSGVAVEIQGISVTADTSREGRGIFLQALTTMPDGGTINWKFPEGWLSLTKAELTSVVQAGVSHIQAAFDWEKGINDQIDAAQSKAALLAIEIVPPPPAPPLPME
jgi:hypothetical protein